MKVEQILKAKGADVFCIREDQVIADAVALLNEKNIGAVVVKNADGAVVGILSERDIVRRIGGDERAILSCPVIDCMTPKPYTCEPDADIQQVMAFMTEKRIRHLPVTDNGQLIGMISIGDVVKRKIELAEQEAEALKEYIAG